MPKVIGFDKSKQRKATCSECAAIVSYVPIEVKEYHGTDYSGGSDGYKWIDCPNCLEKIILERW